MYDIAQQGPVCVAAGDQLLEDSSQTLKVREVTVQIRADEELTRGRELHIDAGGSDLCSSDLCRREAYSELEACSEFEVGRLNSSSQETRWEGRGQRRQVVWREVAKIVHLAIDRPQLT